MRQVSYDHEAVTITIDGITVEGWPYEDKSCSRCSRQGYYYRNYDAIFCADCNAWLDGRCSDPECFYCVNRPTNPLPLHGWLSASG